jgi:DNA-binding transcriptional MerR regulator
MLRLNVDMKSIGEVAASFGLPTHVLRHWESEGLLSPTRKSGARQYSEGDVYRVAAILVAKQAGFALPEIRAMLTSQTATTRHEVLAKHRADLLARIAKAEAALALIEGGLTCEHDNVLNCPNFQDMLKEVPGCTTQHPTPKAKNAIHK